MLSRSSRNDRADGLAGTRHSGDAVNLRCGVRSQDVSSGQRGAVVGGAALCEDRRAVRHELGQSLGDWVAGGRVDDRSCVAWDVGSCRLCRFAAVLARGHSNGAGGEGSGGVSTAGDSHRAGSDGGVCCGSLCVVLWRLRLATGWPASSWVRSTSGPGRVSITTCRQHWHTVGGAARRPCRRRHGRAVGPNRRAAIRST